MHMFVSMCAYTCLCRCVCTNRPSHVFVNVLYHFGSTVISVCPSAEHKFKSSLCQKYLHHCRSSGSSLWLKPQARQLEIQLVADLCSNLCLKPQARSLDFPRVALPDTAQLSNFVKLGIHPGISFDEVWKGNGRPGARRCTPLCVQTAHLHPKALGVCLAFLQSIRYASDSSSSVWRHKGFCWLA